MILLQLFFSDRTFAQVNAYAEVNTINGASLSLGSINTTFGNFVAGERVIIIQMQGASVSGTSNNSSFGALNSLNSAGLFEVATVSFYSSAAGLITLTSALTNNYSVAGNVQVVSFPKLGTIGYATSSNISAVPWNGSIGGIVAFHVQGNLVLLHSISAAGAGFKGGNKAGNDGSPCQGNFWATNSGNPKYADKGEGLFVTPTSVKAGKAKSVNGGGGGIVHNGGGGGGGNFTSGGSGYFGFDGEGCSTTTNAGGQGGIAVVSGMTRLFAGGGGGGGQENNSVGTSGGNGGGLIFISCDSIIVPSIAVTRSISANGDAAPNTNGHDGAGGGGAGGSIFLDVNGVRVNNTSTLRISANGGDGGSVIHPDLHGSGGGGGQGTILISNPGPFSNSIVQTTNGLGGLANLSPNAPRAGSGSGANNVGVKWSAVSVLLPVTLSDFTVKETSEGSAELLWITKTERNNMAFEILHMADDTTWRKIGEVKGAGNSVAENHYEFTHPYPAKNTINYYKLRQKDVDGRLTFSDVVFLQTSNPYLEMKVYPNPSSGIITCESPELMVKGTIYITNSRGLNVSAPVIQESDLKFKVDLTGLPTGLYVIRAENVLLRVIKN